MTQSRAQIVATMGPACMDEKILAALITHGLDVVRFNFSWSNTGERTTQIGRIRSLATRAGKVIPLIADLPGPRVQTGSTHSYDHDAVSAITPKDEELICFAVEQGFEYIAVSFVGSATDIESCREIIDRCVESEKDSEHIVRPKVIAKIERARALVNLEAIIAAADAVMVARGDLGDELPVEQVPFAQERIIKVAKKAGKPVITATQMLLSMTEHTTPTRAEVTDVANAILQGSDAVMLSEETAQGHHPIEAVTLMERIVCEAEKHMGDKAVFNLL